MIATIHLKQSLLYAVILGTAIYLRAETIQLDPPFLGQGDLENWEFRDPDIWGIEDGALRLLTPGQSNGDPIRRPFAWAVLKSPAFSSVRVTAQIRSDRPESVTNRDMLIIFGWQSSDFFYYVHLSKSTTSRHNEVLVVDGADRETIFDIPTPTLVDEAWHDVVVEHDGSTGQIRVWFDEVEVVAFEDPKLSSGRIGFGSFDDFGSIRNVSVEGEILSPYEQWKHLRFTPPELKDLEKSGDAGDPDFDGVSNFSEYWQGTDPMNAASVAISGLSIRREAMGRIKISHPYNPEATDLDYQIQSSASLQPNLWVEDDEAWTDLGSEMNERGYYVRRLVRSGPTSDSFYRIQVSTSEEGQ